MSWDILCTLQLNSQIPNLDPFRFYKWVWFRPIFTLDISWYIYHPNHIVPNVVLNKLCVAIVWEAATCDRRTPCCQASCVLRPSCRDSAAGHQIRKRRGFHGHGGVPQNARFIRENPIYKWMMTGGTPFFGNHHMINMAGWEMAHRNCVSFWDNHRTQWRFSSKPCPIPGGYFSKQNRFSLTFQKWGVRVWSQFEDIGSIGLVLKWFTAVPDMIYFWCPRTGRHLWLWDWSS